MTDPILTEKLYERSDVGVVDIILVITFTFIIPLTEINALLYKYAFYFNNQSTITT